MNYFPMQQSCSSPTIESSKFFDFPPIESVGVTSATGTASSCYSLSDDASSQESSSSSDCDSHNDDYCANFSFELSNSNSVHPVTEGLCGPSNNLSDSHSDSSSVVHMSPFPTACKEVSECSSSTSGPPPPFVEIVFDICLSICHSTAIPAKHWQSLFFSVWAFLAQMEASILISALIISTLVKRHSSALTKSQLDFLYSFHLSDEVRRHSYTPVKFDEADDDIAKSSLRFCLLRCC
jgi:hypothetical protein